MFVALTMMMIIMLKVASCVGYCKMYGALQIVTVHAGDEKTVIRFFSVHSAYFLLRTYAVRTYAKTVQIGQRYYFCRRVGSRSAAFAEIRVFCSLPEAGTGVVLCRRNTGRRAKSQGEHKKGTQPGHDIHHHP